MTEAGFQVRAASQHRLNTMTDRILIPTDGSEHARRAARVAFDLAADLGAAVEILAVADASIVATAGHSGSNVSIQESLEEAAADRANALADLAEEQGLTASTVVRYGTPATQIIDHASENDVDMIVIGTSGRGGVRRAVMGSVADKVIRTAPMPVLAVGPDTEPA